MDAIARGLPCIVTHRRTSRRPGARRQRAYTLLDALVTLAVVSTLTSLAMPSLHRLLAGSRLSTQVNLLVTDLHLARSEAIKRQQDVVLCKSPDGRACAADSEWHQGWMVFADLNGDHQADFGETILRVQAALDGVEIKLSARGGGVQNHYFGYGPDGLGEKNGTFTFCIPGYVPVARAVIVSLSGRPRISRTAAAGGALHCPS